MKYFKYIFIIALLSLTACKTTKKATESVVKTQTQDLSKMQGGMWVPSELEGMNETEMKVLGSKLSAADIYNTTQSSIKDAIVHFDGGCTAEIISDKGLILTNHHCGFGAIQSHSSVEDDYLTDGFWAKDMQSELANPGMTVTFIISMDNVTDQMFANTKGLSGDALKKQLETNSEIITKAVPKVRNQKVVVKSFNKGNQYYLIVSEDYTDIRLVGAAPSSIGKFGADTDNWMWPRHSGDFALFRIYADKDNNPAEYSENNVPYKPKHFLPVSLDGVEAGDFTMVFGFPGSTDEYLPAVAIDQLVNKLNPDKIAIREASLAIMDKYMKSDKKIKIQYASKFARIANYWKKWIGESQGLKQSNAVAQKRELEKEFQRLVKQKGLTAYQNILSDFDALYAEYGDAKQARDYWVEVVYYNINLLNLTFQLYKLEQVYNKKGEKAFNAARNKMITSQQDFYKNYSAQVDQDIFAKLMYMYDAKYSKTKISNQGREQQWKQKAKDVYSKSKLVYYEGFKQLMQGDAKDVLARLAKDPAYIIGKEQAENFLTKINPAYYEIKNKLDPVQTKYLKALQELFPNKRFFPDANSTLRVTYGQVKGYSPKDGIDYLPVSYVEGIMEKYIPGDYEFDVAPKLQELYATKDYGSYKDSNGKMPVNFLGTNHTTGGNSGSPVLDAHGNLIGLNFDRVWEGTMSDYNYDANICRNIMVDARYILFIIDKYAGASHLIEEMKLVHPKK